MLRRTLPFFVTLFLLCNSAFAANRTSWTAGNGVGLTWTAAFASTDLTSLASGSSVLSSAADITNGTALDIYADFSCAVTVGSATSAVSSYIAVYLIPLINNNGGTVYGDGTLPAGTQEAFSPGPQPVGTISIRGNVALTNLSGMVQGIVIPPGSFRWAVTNATGIAFSGTAANNVCQYRTYNINLNN